MFFSFSILFREHAFLYSESASNQLVFREDHVFFIFYFLKLFMSNAFACPTISAPSVQHIETSNSTESFQPADKRGGSVNVQIV